MRHTLDCVGNPPAAVDLHVIGVGRDAIERSLRGLLRTLRHSPAGERQRPLSGLLLLGFAGAVDPSLTIGDLILARRYCRLVPRPELLVSAPERVTLEDISRLRAGLASGGFARYVPLPPGMASEEQVIPRRAVLKFLEPDSRMLQQAGEALAHRGLTAIETDSMTVPRPVADTNEKRELHRQFEAGAVNMEDYWVARLSIAAKVPFLSVRAVLDTADQGLPSFLMGLSGRPGRAAMSALAMPWRAPTMLRVARQMRQAQQSLARFARAFVDCQQESAHGGTGAAP